MLILQLIMILMIIIMLIKAPAAEAAPPASAAPPVAEVEPEPAEEGEGWPELEPEPAPVRKEPVTLATLPISRLKAPGGPPGRARGYVWQVLSESSLAV